MMLEILTLIVLAVVLATKYFTAKHIQTLTQEKNTLTAAVNDYELQFKKLQGRRKEHERNFEHLKRDRYGLETFLQRLQDSLVTQQEKNRELENLII